MFNKAIETNNPYPYNTIGNDYCDTCAAKAYCDKSTDITVRLCMDSKPTCMTLTPNGTTCIMTVEEAEEYFSNMTHHAVVYNDNVFLACDPDEIVTLGITEYLVGTALIFEIDDNGNESYLTADTVSDAMEFFENCAVDIEVNGRFFPAIRLE